MNTAENSVNESFPSVFETSNVLMDHLRNQRFGRYRLYNGEIFTVDAETTYVQTRQAQARCHTIFLLKLP
jgi:hypothetical protein